MVEEKLVVKEKEVLTPLLIIIYLTYYMFLQSLNFKINTANKTYKHTTT